MATHFPESNIHKTGEAFHFFFLAIQTTFQNVLRMDASQNFEQVEELQNAKPEKHNTRFQKPLGVLLSKE